MIEDRITPIHSAVSVPNRKEITGEHFDPLPTHYRIQPFHFILYTLYLILFTLQTHYQIQPFHFILYILYLILFTLQTHYRIQPFHSFEWLCRSSFLPHHNVVVSIDETDYEIRDLSKEPPPLSRIYNCPDLQKPALVFYFSLL